MRESKIRYNPALSVKEIAKRSGVTEAAVRFYIKQNHIDRRYEKKVAIIEECRKYLMDHPSATMNEIANATGYSHSTIKIYWENISTETELTDFDSNKKQNRQLRQYNNFYATHPSVTQDILRVEKFNNDILEPFCGTGTMADVIKDNGYDVDAYDIIDRNYGKVADFFKEDFTKGKYDIISNPPYDTSLCDIVIKCLNICKEKTALIFPLRYLSGQERYNQIFKKNPPARVYAYINRISIAKNAEFHKYEAGSNMEIYAWYVWDKSYKGKTELKWIQNQPYIPHIIEECNQESTKIIDYRIGKEVKGKPYHGLIRCSKDYAYFFQGMPLSNWWPSEPKIKYDGHEFSSSETLFMYLKAKTFKDEEMAERIAPSKYNVAKKMGRQVRNFSQEIWDVEGPKCMYIALEQKLKYDKEFKEVLLSPNYFGKTFVEASPYDKIWGIKQPASDEVILAGPKKWKGKNLLGQVLTEIRDGALLINKKTK